MRKKPPKKQKSMRKDPQDHRPKKQRQTHIANQKERDLGDEPQEKTQEIYIIKKSKIS